MLYFYIFEGGGGGVSIPIQYPLIDRTNHWKTIHDQNVQLHSWILTIFLKSVDSMKQICSLHIYIFNDISKDGKDIETAKKVILLPGYSCIFNLNMQQSLFKYFCAPFHNICIFWRKKNFIRFTKIRVFFSVYFSPKQKKKTV